MLTYFYIFPPGFYFTVLIDALAPKSPSKFEMSQKLGRVFVFSTMQNEPGRVPPVRITGRALTARGPLGWQTRRQRRLVILKLVAFAPGLFYETWLETVNNSRFRTCLAVSEFGISHYICWCQYCMSI